MSQFARLLGIAMVALTATGCAPHIDDLVAYTNDVKQNTKPSIEPYPEFEQKPVFVYDAQGFRSPFVRPKASRAPVVAQVKANCSQPDANRTREPLEAYGIDALSLTGRFRSNGDTWVLFKTNDGGLYQAKKRQSTGFVFRTDHQHRQGRSDY